MLLVQDATIVDSLVNVVGAQINKLRVTRLVGKVSSVSTSLLQVTGLNVPVGSICEIKQPQDTGESLLAEVVSSNQESGARLIPFSSTSHITLGAEVFADPTGATVEVGNEYLGRILDGLGRPLDGRRKPAGESVVSLNGVTTDLACRATPSRQMATGIKAIDCLSALGFGQRVGMFAASGVGKTTLLTSICKNIQADIKIICLIGERGREALEYWEDALSEEDRSRSILILSTSDQSAPMRIRASLLAASLAEYFRARHKDVVVVLDSLTRLAYAWREVGLAVGEPPTIRALTPSVFSQLPAFIERFGPRSDSGTSTLLASVLCEDDEVDDPLTEILKSLLDGHIVLSQKLAEQGHYPAIDVLTSISRVARRVAPSGTLELAIKLCKARSLLESSSILVESGLYKSGTNNDLDEAISKSRLIDEFLQQSTSECVALDMSLNRLSSVFSTTKTVRA